jgi:hypothetical protein
MVNIKLDRSPRRDARGVIFTFKHFRVPWETFANRSDDRVPRGRSGEALAGPRLSVAMAFPVLPRPSRNRRDEVESAEWGPTGVSPVMEAYPLPGTSASGFEKRLSVGRGRLRGGRAGDPRRDDRGEVRTVCRKKTCVRSPRVPPGCVIGRFRVQWLFRLIKPLAGVPMPGHAGGLGLRRWRGYPESPLRALPAPGAGLPTPPS